VRNHTERVGRAAEAGREKAQAADWSPKDGSGDLWITHLQQADVAAPDALPAALRGSGDLARSGERTHSSVFAARAALGSFRLRSPAGHPSEKGCASHLLSDADGSSGELDAAAERITAGYGGARASEERAGAAAQDAWSVQTLRLSQPSLPNLDQRAACSLLRCVPCMCGAEDCRCVVVQLRGSRSRHPRAWYPSWRCAG
jgi:hypothetical protein